MIVCGWFLSELAIIVLSRCISYYQACPARQRMYSNSQHMAMIAKVRYADHRYMYMWYTPESRLFG